MTDKAKAPKATSGTVAQDVIVGTTSYKKGEAVRGADYASLAMLTPHLVTPEKG